MAGLYQRPDARKLDLNKIFKRKIILFVESIQLNHLYSYSTGYIELNFLKL